MRLKAILLLITLPLLIQSQPLTSSMHHLRKGLKREWAEFPATSKQDSLSISFNSTAERKNYSISLTQYDVKQDWSVAINQKPVGNLVTDEKLMKVYFDVPAALIHAGTNKLVIFPSKKYLPGEETDDIRVGLITLHDRSKDAILKECALEVTVSDKKTSALLPSKITVINQQRALQSLQTNNDIHLATRNGAVYTSTGKAVINLPAGTYTIYAGRGVEYGIDSAVVSLRAGDRLQKAFSISHEVSMPGWLSSDTHIHTLTYSGHGDATIAERAITIAGEGIQLPIMTEHNKQVSIASEMNRLQLNHFFTPVIGNEVTTTVGHFNFFPMDTAAPVPDYRVQNWSQLSAIVESRYRDQVVILNHARDIHNSFRPFDSTRHIAVAGLDLEKEKFPANAMEVMNSGSQQTDIMRLFHDWFGMLNAGYRLTPAASSDSHDVLRYTIGQARTYIKYAKADATPVDNNEVIKNFLDGKVLVSFGLMVMMKINDRYEAGELVPGGKNVKVSIEVDGPSWLQANHVALYMNGEKIREARINTKGKVVKWKGEWILPNLQHDVFLVAIAQGPAPYLPYWPVAKPYQPASPQWTPKLIGSTGAVWIDADEDGQFSSAKALAGKVITESTGDVLKLMKQLRYYDESVAVQTAALLQSKGYDFSSAAFTSALKTASTETRSGFNRFLSELKTSAAGINRK